MITITTSAIEKIKEELTHYLKQGEMLFVRLSMGIG